MDNAEEALDALAKREYAIVLMDCQTAIVDGYQATMEIRKRGERGAHRPAHRQNGERARRRSRKLPGRGDGRLAKPTKAGELEQALARYFAER